MAEHFQKLKKRMTKENMAVMVLIGVLLLVISVPTERRKNTQTDQDDIKQTAVADDDAVNGKTEEERYAEELKNQLKELLESMDGVGEVKVMLTIEASKELIVEKDIESTVYSIDADGAKMPYVKMARQPEVRGVTVVAEGGGSGIVQKNITEVIEALFGIDAHKIRVVKMK